MIRLIVDPPRPLRRMTGMGLALVAGLIAWILLTPGLGPSEAYALDKVTHAVAFAGLGFLSAITWPDRRGLLLGLAGLAVLAVLTEGMQTLVPGRTGSPGDALADLAGALLGLGGVAWLRLRHGSAPGGTPQGAAPQGEGPVRWHGTPCDPGR
ncbi:MAG: hypothetical protein RLY86_1428 [Pseudomonadota bacterium]